MQSCLNTILVFFFCLPSFFHLVYFFFFFLYKMTLSIHEQEPLLTESSQNRSNYVVTKDLDEESLGDNKRVDEHDAEYIVNNRLGNVSLFMVTLW